MKKKKWITILWGLIMLFIIVLNLLLSKNTKVDTEVPKSYEHETMDDSKKNPNMRGVQ